MHFHFGRRRIVQEEGMFTHVWYPRICSAKGAFCEGVHVDQFQGNHTQVELEACKAFPQGNLLHTAHTIYSNKNFTSPSTHLTK